MKQYRFCFGRFDKYITRSTVDYDYEFIDSYGTSVDFVVIKVDMILDEINIKVTHQIFPEACMYRSNYEIFINKREGLIFFSEDTFIGYIESLFKYYDNLRIMNQIKEKGIDLSAWNNVLRRLTPAELQHSKFNEDPLSLDIYPLGIKISKVGEYKGEVRWKISDLSDITKKNTVVYNSNLDLLLKDYEKTTQR